MHELYLQGLCKKLSPVLGKRAQFLWLSYATAESYPAKMEAEALIQMMASKYLPQSLDNTSVLLNPPSVNDSTGDVFIGDVYFGKQKKQPLFLRRENFQKHIGIFAITGGGKSNLGYLILLGLEKIGVPFLVVDWKRSYRALKHKIDSLKIYTIGRRSSSPLNWNPLRPPPGIHIRTWIAVVCEVLEKSHISGQGVADIMIEVLDRCFDQKGFFEGNPEVYPNFHDARQMVDQMQLRGRKMLWQDSCSRILRTFTYGPASGAFNSRHPVALEEILEENAILELDQELPKPLRVFFSEIVLRWIHLYRLGQGESVLKHVTFLEEVHNLFPRSQIEKQASNSLESVFREIRSFGEGLVNITQHPSLLPVYILGNCNTQVYLGLQHEDDIITAKRALFLERGDEKYLDLLKVGEAIIKIKGRIDPCLVKIPLVEVKHGSVRDGDL